MSTTCPERQRGFGIIAAIVILVILAGLAGAITALTTSQNISLAQDAQGARAYQAARAGTEYGLSLWLSTSPSVDANCPTIATASAVALPALGFSFDLTGTVTTSSGVKFCTLVATAWPSTLSKGATGSLGYSERQLRVVVEGNP